MPVLRWASPCWVRQRLRFRNHRLRNVVDDDDPPAPVANRLRRAVSGGGTRTGVQSRHWYPLTNSEAYPVNAIPSHPVASKAWDLAQSRPRHYIPSRAHAIILLYSAYQVAKICITIALCKWVCIQLDPHIDSLSLGFVRSHLHFHAHIILTQA
jgi:hypothetical protein